MHGCRFQNLIRMVNRMDDLISRQAAIDMLEERLQANGYSNVDLVSELNRSIGYLMRLPSVDAVEVVRCAECYHYDDESEKCILNNSEFKPTDYCSYGSE